MVRSPTIPQLPSGTASRTKEAWLAAVVDAERRGELLAAFDLADRALREYAADTTLQHLAVLALARSGSTHEAARRFVEYRLGDIEDEDTASLHARIKKDTALAADGDERRRLAIEAASAYRAIYDRTGGYYPLVNAATLSFVAGDRDRAMGLAGEVLRIVAASSGESYYTVASQAEAHLLRGELDAAEGALERAALVNSSDYGALSTTRRQLRMICRIAGYDERLLRPLAGPKVVHFCGHRIGFTADAPFLVTDEGEVARDIEKVVAEENVGFAYGSLASGADILWAETLLAHGVELHVVLPFALEEFVASSVAPAGRNWVERFSRCLERAASLTYGTADAHEDDEVLYRYCAELAMGLALVRARYLDADVQQLAVWDGRPARGDAGTAIDVAQWQRAGRSCTVVTPSPRHGQRGAGAPAELGEPSLTDERGPRRVVRAMLFADVKGFSKLTDEQLPAFGHHVFAALAAVLDRHADVIEYCNTWGDALYIVAHDAMSAARCALELQDAIEHVHGEAFGLPTGLTMRLGGHVGPVFPVVDPVMKNSSFVGSHVTRTARIEPVTPPGAVYVTEPFAAALELTPDHPFACDYVGHMPAAKDYGLLRMYRLRQRAGTVAGQTPRRDVNPGTARSRSTP
jgi:class 3 adenylate cyclase/tetratricopeptide (TPR) repeat protein